ncbi:enterochelin esterase domain-containing protein [Actinomyces naeslundii]|uniref:PF11806 domain protein n=1 Tax=Actinomyces naeslundii (strain ATCC 12104 / DSM 43013 / CCUG 2238 / JCM 8349 / NCTC 10301 / Howell 279) TaxID=1115803 RepID=J2ZTW1_ACTNH|nr:enterochelin esterase domain-containing protein [Actinomyces naeslundii]EJN86055.1 PF11806 domain protein [Actinomyces naeslundii str. Howell 279]
MSGIRPDDVLVRETRWRELTSTPVAPGGGLLPAAPAWWPRKPDDDALAAAAARGTPVLGETRLVDGVTMREATFLWCDDRRHGESPSVLIHLNTLTDNHRTHIVPALANRVPGTGWWALHVLLPDDALVGYRIVVTRDRLPDDVGARRECWKRVHAEGRPDALCPDRLHDGFGFVSSLWEGPGAVTHPEWSVASAEGVMAAPSIDPSGGGYGYSVEVGGGALDGFDAPGDSARRITLWQQDCCGGSDGGRRERGQDQGRGLLVLLDGEIWRRNDVVRRLGARAASWDLLLIDSGSLTMRARDLADPHRSRELVIRCLEAVRSLRPPCDPQRVVVAGQSRGGCGRCGSRPAPPGCRCSCHLPVGLLLAGVRPQGRRGGRAPGLVAPSR